MSIQLATNGVNLRRTTSFADAQPLTIVCWYQIISIAADSFYTVWDHAGTTPSNYFPELYYDPGGLGGPNQGIALAYNNTYSQNLSIAAITAGTWYFGATVFNGTANPAVHYHGAGGALTTSTSAQNFGGFEGAAFTWGDTGDNIQTLNGRIVAAKLFTTNLSVTQVENEYRRIVRINPSIYSFQPLTSAPNAGVDFSGQGNTFTVNGAPATSRSMPPIPFRGALDIQ